MKRFFAAFFSAIVLLLTVASCNWTHSDEPAPIAFDSLVIDSVCPMFRNYAKPACHISISIEKPAESSQSAAVSQLEKALASLPRDGALVEGGNATLQEMARNYVREYIFQYLLDGKEAIDCYHGDVEAASTWLNYEEVVEGNVKFNAYGFLCYQFRIYSYAGGAHGNTMVRNCAFDRHQSRVLLLNDLFAEASQPAVSAMIQQRLLEKYECTAAEQLAAIGFFDLASVSATDNFFFDYDGVTFVYDPYEIATYSCGVIEVKLPWRDLGPLMLSDSPLTEMSEMYGI